MIRPSKLMALAVLASALMAPVKGAEPSTADDSIEASNTIASDGVWHLHLLEGEGESLRFDRANYVFLTQVESLGPRAKAKTPDREDDSGPEQRKGVLTVKEKLFARTDRLNVSKVTKLAISSCDGLKPGDFVIVFVNDGEDFYGAYAIDAHIGTTSKLGVKLEKPDTKGQFPANAKRFIELLKLGDTPIRDFSKEDFAIWKHFDPVGAADELDLVNFGKPAPPKK